MEKIIINNFEINIIRKNIKNIHLSILPPDGRIRVSAPINTKDGVIRMLIISKSSWIKKQQLKFENQTRQTKREYVSGESHYHEGKRYLLNVIPSRSVACVMIRNMKYIDLYVKENSTQNQKQLILDKWYRDDLKSKVENLISKWTEIIGVNVNSFKIRRMKTRWGSCNINTKNILINFELAKTNINCLEYVVVHEIVHLLERHHNDNFKMLMDNYLPKWRQYKSELNGIVFE